jgi:hypothetical protein
MIQSLIAFLLEIHATTWVSANLLDSEDAGVKVFHQRAKQGEQAKRYVVFNVLAQTPIYAKAEMAMQTYPVSFSVFADTDHEAEAIAQNLVTIVECWTGEHGGKHWSYTTLERMVEGWADNQRLASKIVDFEFYRQN